MFNKLKHVSKTWIRPQLPIDKKNEVINKKVGTEPTYFVAPFLLSNKMAVKAGTKW